MKRTQTCRRSALLALALAALVLPAQSVADTEHWHGSRWSYHSSDCAWGNETDPIGAVFHGDLASTNYLGGYPYHAAADPPGVSRWHVGDIPYQTKHFGDPWTLAPASNQWYSSFNQCNAFNLSLASPTGGDNNRYHIRLWTQPSGTHGYTTVGTPHYERNGPGCSSHYVHAQEPTPYGGSGSGYDRARLKLYYAFKHAPHHYVHEAYWGDSAHVQCVPGNYVASNGYVALIQVSVDPTASG